MGCPLSPLVNHSLGVNKNSQAAKIKAKLKNCASHPPVCKVTCHNGENGNKRLLLLQNKVEASDVINEMTELSIAI